MRTSFLFAAPALLAACSAPADKPDAAVVSKIEQMLSADPCIGSMDQWSRRYAFGLDSQTGGSDRRTIWFLFQEANKYEFREGRTIVEPDKFITLDDRSYRSASGTYTPSRDKLEINHCGPNV